MVHAIVGLVLTPAQNRGYSAEDNPPVRYRALLGNGMRVGIKRQLRPATGDYLSPAHPQLSGRRGMPIQRLAA